MPSLNFVCFLHPSGNRKHKSRRTNDRDYGLRNRVKNKGQYHREKAGNV
jgi:hypothetical protein